MPFHERRRVHRSTAAGEQVNRWLLSVPNPTAPIGEPISSRTGSVEVSLGRRSWASVATGKFRVWVVDWVVVTMPLLWL
jgi:hypothetical protein